MPSAVTLPRATTRLSQSCLLQCPPSVNGDYAAHLYVVRSPRRDALRVFLQAHGIATDVHYPIADHLQPAYPHAHLVGALEVTQAACAEVVSLPCYPGMLQSDVDRVIGAVQEFSCKTKARRAEPRYPVYRNEGSLPDLIAAVHGLSEQLGGAMETIFVVDGSPDRCYEILRERLPQCAFRSRLVLLTQFWLVCGYSCGARNRRWAVLPTVMAADLQEPPNSS